MEAKVGLICRVSIGIVVYIFMKPYTQIGPYLVVILCPVTSDTVIVVSLPEFNTNLVHKRYARANKCVANVRLRPNRIEK